MLCKECGLGFPSDRSLHAHLKVHGIFVAEYYCKHFPRHDLLTGDAIQFKEKNEYFSSFFSNRENMIEWLSITSTKEAQDVVLKMLSRRIKEKKLTVAPNEVELFFANLPPISEYKKLFGSYTKACELAECKPALTGKLSSEWNNDFSKKKIYYDSREQKPLQFANSECLKLDTGDYSTMGDDFSNTFVDRKSFDDWCGTLVGSNLERFRREIIRCKTQNCFLWVVIECPLTETFNLSKSSYHKPNISYVAHNMRALSSEFPRHLRFLFSGSRENSQLIIPKILCLGNKLENVDLQYFLGK